MDNKINNGVGFASSAFSGKLNIDGEEYRLAIIGADDRAKFKFNVFVYNREETYQTVLFSKDKKSENSPNYGGQIKLNNGAEYWISVWHKKSKDGKYYMSLSVNSKDGQPVMDTKSSFSDEDSEIPF